MKQKNPKKSCFFHPTFLAQEKSFLRENSPPPKKAGGEPPILKSEVPHAKVEKPPVVLDQPKEVFHPVGWFTPRKMFEKTHRIPWENGIFTYIHDSH